jgi:hypothetical protein
MLLLLCLNILSVKSAGWLGIHFTIGTSCERAAPLAEKNAAAQRHVLRSPDKPAQWTLCILLLAMSELLQQYVICKKSNKSHSMSKQHRKETFLTWPLRIGWVFCEIIFPVEKSIPAKFSCCMATRILRPQIQSFQKTIFLAQFIFGQVA